MSNAVERLQRWSWHQSHDQATVLLHVPLDMDEEDLSIHLDERFLIVTLRGEPSAIKGRLYETISTQASSWQLERSRGNTSARRRKARPSSTSAGSSDSSSYAVLTDPDISSSFTTTQSFTTTAPSPGQTDAENETEYEFADDDRDQQGGGVPNTLRLASTARRPLSTFSSSGESHDESSNGSWTGPPKISRRDRSSIRNRFTNPSATSSRPSSPNTADPSLTSSLASSANSSRVPRRDTRLLTIHLEKTRPEIWPALIVSGVPPDVELESLATASELSFASTSTATVSTSLEDQQYNMDPTSLVGVGMMTLHEDIDQAFEYFCRAWLLVQDAVAAMKLVSVYVPLHMTPRRSTIIPSEHSYPRYLRRIGGNPGLAVLYRQAGNIYMQGLGASLSGSTSTLSNSPFSLGLNNIDDGQTGAGSSSMPDIETAQRYFRRARVLDPTLEVPDVQTGRDRDDVKLVMPVMDIGRSAATVKDEALSGSGSTAAEKRRHRGEGPRSLAEQDEWSYLYLPGLVGAGVAIGIVGIMSASWWRSSNR